MYIFTHIQSFNPDLYTPVGLYGRVRHRYRKPIILECNDYHARSESHSYIGFNPLAEIFTEQDTITLLTNEETRHYPIDRPRITEQLEALLGQFTFHDPCVPGNGFFVRCNFEFAHFSEPSQIPEAVNDLPHAHFILYEYLFVIDHFHNNARFIVNTPTPQHPCPELLEELLHRSAANELPFFTTGNAVSSVSDTDFLAMVEKALEHIRRGDVFQLVVSRPFVQPFFGDDFQIYRHLRRLNPSPYLFYADMESYRLMGSSPETQLQLKNGKAIIHPIAGTVRKTGNAFTDKENAASLVADEKENAEHTMLVDLARNDLSKCCTNVYVDAYKEVQEFSHVIHLVSKVSGKTMASSPLAVFGATFPAGTLSGTPKPKALELIARYEFSPRGYYGGAIGWMTTDGDLNTSIVIRSILSSNNELHFRAGAGVVLDSDPHSELEEVNNKLGAVHAAIKAAASPQITSI